MLQDSIKALTQSLNEH
jgi:chromosome segregation ATPase